ncbi:unnamed protein product [Didymodactylos carnosus]|uniref:Rap-GAP domain-containing protein n=1 Tax=Didymodactylos carnosus TaxID=1234261 RepID=A0A813SMN0_9BILA|nr:unnamed protein product [Didymodactylos carnosus]CAF0796627.1 unnamed protein product [Didymodactylos carnosus]CAF3497016.1 unnamed protein product [Didymodactylos carnosus]CAF3581304.1 unnamed protein product [Didymodactylos carnosus]
MLMEIGDWEASTWLQIIFVHLFQCCYTYAISEITTNLYTLPKMLNSFRRRRPKARLSGTNGTTTTDGTTVSDLKGEHHPNVHKLQSLQKHDNNRQHYHGKHSIHRQENTSQMDSPPAIPPRKPVEKKNSSCSMYSTSNNSLIWQQNSSVQNDNETSLKITNKEISTSLMDLLGNAIESLNNGINRDTKTLPILPVFNGENVQFSLKNGRASLSNTRISTSSSNVDKLRPTLSDDTNQQGTVLLSSKSVDSYWTEDTDSSLKISYPPYNLEIDDKAFTYRNYFSNTEHSNWYGNSELRGPVIISFKTNPQKTFIVRTKQQTYIQTISDTNSSVGLKILNKICENCDINDVDKFDPILCDGAQELLSKYDEHQVSNQHKFGVIFQREDQFTEEDMFSNETHNDLMEEFLNILGNRIKLKDFHGYRGGLDIKTDQTGIESIHEVYNNHEIMFHISTFLPYSKLDRQQLERKRHIGNDLVTIVFQESEEILFEPECITSQFLHVYLIITPIDDNKYKVTIKGRDGVPLFGPSLPESSVFERDNNFKQWLLAKLINGELACYKTNSFQKLQERTKANLLENLYRTLHDMNQLCMEYLLTNSQYKFEQEQQQQQHQQQHLQVQSSSLQKTSDTRENGLLGSVRRRLYPKIRIQTSSADTKQTIVSATSSINGDIDLTRSKTRSMTMDLKRSISRESVITNNPNTNNTSLKNAFLFKNNNSRDKNSTPNTPTSRFLLPENDLASIRLSPSCLSSPFEDNGHHFNLFDNELSPNNSPPASYNSSLFKFKTNGNESISYENGNNTNRDSSYLLSSSTSKVSMDEFQTQSKEELIKSLINMQQFHNTRLAELDQRHRREIKRLEMQLTQENSIQITDSP